MTRRYDPRLLQGLTFSCMMRSSSSFVVVLPRRQKGPLQRRRLREGKQNTCKGDTRKGTRHLTSQVFQPVAGCLSFNSSTSLRVSAFVPV